MKHGVIKSSKNRISISGKFDWEVCNGILVWRSERALPVQEAFLRTVSPREPIIFRFYGKNYYQDRKISKRQIE